MELLVEAKNTKVALCGILRRMDEKFRNSILNEIKCTLEYNIHSVLPLVLVSIAPFIYEMGKTF